MQKDQALGVVLLLVVLLLALLLLILDWLLFGGTCAHQVAG